MKLDTEFYKLPLRFEVERLVEEVLQFTEAEWRPHPQGYAGNTAIPLVTVGGGLNDEVRGPMKPTPFLQRCPYIQQILKALGTVIGRARLMRIAGEADANAHVDASYYWRHHVRVHIPAVTSPQVRFLCGDKSVHMASGETWIFDSWKLHNVVNPAATSRIHLVADTVGNAHFWNNLVARAARPVDPAAGIAPEPQLIAYTPGADTLFPLETRNFPVVMTPWEQQLLAAEIFSGAGEIPDEVRLAVSKHTQSLHRDWLCCWTEFGDSEAGWNHFDALLAAYDDGLAAWKGRAFLANGMDLIEALRHSIVRPALNPEIAGFRISAERSDAAIDTAGNQEIHVSTSRGNERSGDDPLQRPVFIVGAPRSGSTMLYELLSRSPGFITIGGESHGLIEGIAKLNPAMRDWDSNCLTAADADAETSAELRSRIGVCLREANSASCDRGSVVHFLEKTPKNALRIPFLRAVFPDARFIYLYRKPEENISSILEAWRSGRFVTYRKLPGWDGAPWSLALIPGWRELAGLPLAEVATRQWAAINERALADLESLPPEEWCAISYAEIVEDPQAAAVKLCAFAGVSWTESITSPLPPSRYTLTPPEEGKWRKNEAEMRPFLHLAEPLIEEARAVLDAARPKTPPAASSPVQAQPVELASVHTSNLPELLSELGISLLVTTYQAGRLIVIREQAGSLNTHFRSFAAPMGLAYDGARLAIGAGREILHFVNQAEVAPKIPPANTHDAAFLPRSTHHTGDIRIHEMGYVGDELWAVNTRFSCLCSFDSEHSFVPRWRPPFVTALAPEDRCHLNGMAICDDAVKYVTCHGATDLPGGWREGKASGGCLLEVPGGEVIAEGLSMPHSPRVYGGKLWVLESGQGALLRIDPATGERQEIARLPGFTRGMDFFGPFAFIGLSQVRETAIFSGLPLTERLPEQERTCGVWVIDLRTGSTAAFLRFESGVQEVFAVQVLPGIRHPDVVTDDENLLASSFVIPESHLKEVPPALLGRLEVA